MKKRSIEKKRKNVDTRRSIEKKEKRERET